MELAAGLSFGLPLETSVGPVCLAVLQKVPDERWLHAWAMAWGVAPADAFYIALAAAGVAALMQVEALQMALSVAGALVLLYFAVRIWRALAAVAGVAAGRGGLAGSLLYGTAITITNPLTVLFWGGVFGRLVVDGSFASPTALVPYAAGWVAATLGFLAVVPALAGQAKRLLSARIRVWANRATAVFPVGFACRIALDLASR